MDFDDYTPFRPYLSKHTSFTEWVDAMISVRNDPRRQRKVAHMDPARLEVLGFVEVKTSAIKILVGVWAENEQVQEDGKHFLITVLARMEAVCHRPLTEHMGWTAEGCVTHARPLPRSCGRLP
jgi:hypothetical protein